MTFIEYINYYGKTQMFRRTLATIFILVLAFGILFTSVLRAVSIKYNFSNETNGQKGTVLGEKVEIDYLFPYPGRVLPDSPLWVVKALRDRLWLFLTTNTGKKAEIKLLFADKRIVMSKTLFEKEKPEMAYSTLTKAEKYLVEACNLEEENRRQGMDTSGFLNRLSKASLKHRQVIDEILEIAPEDARPGIIKTQDYSKEVYNKTKSALESQGLPIVEDPFNSE